MRFNITAADEEEALMGLRCYMRNSDCDTGAFEVQDFKSTYDIHFHTTKVGNVSIHVYGSLRGAPKEYYTTLSGIVK